MAGARAEVALLEPLRDATLIESATGSLANGSGPAFFAGRNSSLADSIRRGLIAFDVASAIPAGSIVTGATLRLNMSATNAGPVPVPLHRVLDGWGEGASSASGGGGAPAVEGDATWIHRFHEDVFWLMPGGDFDPAPRAATLVDQNGFYIWGPTLEMTADVQSWLDHPETAHGWLLAGDEGRPTTVKRFDAREHPEIASRPLLEVTYLPPCVPDPLGPGFWEKQCGTGGGPPAEPGFADRILPCARGILDDLGLPDVDPCAALLAPAPRTCRERAERKLVVVIFNLCAGRLQ
ncbi:MAG: DNRLRE domain-containing protein, partial [Candidatus Polarisedimenticolia bacterium]